MKYIFFSLANLRAPIKYNIYEQKPLKSTNFNNELQTVSNRSQVEQLVHWKFPVTTVPTKNAVRVLVSYTKTQTASLVGNSRGVLEIEKLTKSTGKYHFDFLFDGRW